MNCFDFQHKSFILAKICKWCINKFLPVWLIFHMFNPHLLLVSAYKFFSEHASVVISNFCPFSEILSLYWFLSCFCYLLILPNKPHVLISVSIIRWNVVNKSSYLEENIISFSLLSNCLRKLLKRFFFNWAVNNTNYKLHWSS